MLGLHFEICNPFLFEVRFDNCQLNLSSFYKLSMKGTTFNGSSIQEVDFVEANLTKSTFTNCDLLGALFENTVLEQSDFREAYNYSIDPEMNRIAKAKFSSSGLQGLLSKYDIVVD